MSKQPPPAPTASAVGRDLGLKSHPKGDRSCHPWTGSLACYLLDYPAPGKTSNQRPSNVLDVASVSGECCTNVACPLGRPY